MRNIFDRYGKVQTCIVNKEKRHAFVKMISRADAVSAKEAMEKNRTPDSQLRVCSVIDNPSFMIQKLTSTDTMGCRIWTP